MTVQNFKSTRKHANFSLLTVLMALTTFGLYFAHRKTKQDRAKLSQEILIVRSKTDHLVVVDEARVHARGLRPMWDVWNRWAVYCPGRTQMKLFVSVDHQDVHDEYSRVLEQGRHLVGLSWNDGTDDGNVLLHIDDINVWDHQSGDKFDGSYHSQGVLSPVDSDPNEPLELMHANGDNGWAIRMWVVQESIDRSQTP